MSMMERLYQIDQMLANRTVVSKEELLQRLGISLATFKRDLAYLRDRLNAPIVFDYELGGYRFEKPKARTGPDYKLPGLWFSADEVYALLTMHHLLSNLDGEGLLGPHIEPLMARITGLLDSGDHNVEEIRKRVHVETMGSRPIESRQFQVVGRALLARKRLRIRYHARGTGETLDREVSPQRLMYYRDNWYLDAWCHLREGLRAFAVDSIEQVEMLERAARNVSMKQLNETLGAGYGIFFGGQVRWAKLLFSQKRARWVVSEKWHKDQKGTLLPDGRYQLEVPYDDDRELVADILKFGTECQVLEPKELKAAVKTMAQGIARLYA